MPRTSAKRERLVRYCPGATGGSPGWMSRDRAEALLEEDDKRYLRMVENARLGMFGPDGVNMIRLRGGAPHIEDPR